MSLAVWDRKCTPYSLNFATAKSGELLDRISGGHTMKGAGHKNPILYKAG